MGKKKKHKKEKTEGSRHPKLPANACFWLEVTKKPKEIRAFLERGKDEALHNLRLAINYRLWQIQEKLIAKDFFGDLDVKKLKYKTNHIIVERITEKQLYEDMGAIPEKKPEKKTKQPIDLFDFSNIGDLVKEQ
jgi:hypothetical protein